jgi:D-alanyl-D-alanine carboxypeptidase
LIDSPKQGNYRATFGTAVLDDPISKFRKDVPDGEHITIAELSEMRSGLFSYTFDKGFNEAIDRHPRKAWTPNELLKIAFRHKSNFAPGAEYEYNNTNIALLGVVISSAPTWKR